MTHDGIAKVQHYVPYFVLKRWGVGKKDHVNVFEKATRKTWNSKARNIARESGFYNFSGPDGDATYEPALAKLETSASRPISALVDHECLLQLTPTDRDNLSAFFAVQFVRTPAFRSMMSGMLGSLESRLRAGMPAHQDADLTVRELMGSTEHDVQSKAISLDMLQSAPGNFARHFIDKTWVLLTAPPGREFLIGDNPIAMQNQTDRNLFWGNIGLGVKGIEIYFPLSPRLCLAMYCPSHRRKMEELQQEARELAQLAGLPSDHLLAPFTSAFLGAIKTGKPMRCSADNIDNINSVQVWSAERHVFAANEGFALVHRMLDANPRYREGPRVTTG